MKDLEWLYSANEPGVQEKQEVQDPTVQPLSAGGLNLQPNFQKRRGGGGA